MGLGDSVKKALEALGFGGSPELIGLTATCFFLLYLILTSDAKSWNEILNCTIQRLSIIIRIRRPFTNVPAVAQANLNDLTSATEAPIKEANNKSLRLILWLAKRRYIFHIADLDISYISIVIFFGLFIGGTAGPENLLLYLFGTTVLLSGIYVAKQACRRIEIGLDRGVKEIQEHYAVFEEAANDPNLEWINEVRRVMDGP